jgi:hypothetical protein
MFDLHIIELDENSQVQSSFLVKYIKSRQVEGTVITTDGAAKNLDVSLFPTSVISNFISHIIN